MRKHLVTAVVAASIGMGIGGVGMATASTPKPSGYCAKAELGKRVKYTTPSKKSSYYLTCKKATTQRWQR